MQKIISEIVKEREKQRLSETELAKKIGADDQKGKFDLFQNQERGCQGWICAL